MNKNWVTETALMLKKVNDRTEQLLHLNLSDEEFHKRHQEIMDYWDNETLRLREKYPLENSFKARPKSHHLSHHMTNKYQMKKMFNKYYEKKSRA